MPLTPHIFPVVPKMSMSFRVQNYVIGMKRLLCLLCLMHYCLVFKIHLKQRSEKLTSCRISPSLPSDVKAFCLQCIILLLSSLVTSTKLSILSHKIWCFYLSQCLVKCMAPIRCSKMLEERQDRMTEGWKEEERKKQGRGKERKDHLRKAESLVIAIALVSFYGTNSYLQSTYCVPGTVLEIR